MVGRDETEEIIFLAALERPTLEERAAYVESACGQDPALRRRIEELLRCHDAAAGPLDQPPPGVADPAATGAIERPGQTIGRYKLLEEIGEGGMGVVYLAEQQEPIRRRVALKIVKPGMDTRQVVARFEAERQALALMDHPNIAKVFDGGTTDSGRPYFVMELAEGIPLTDYCDQHRLATRERLELFVQVCRAVQHAHTKGIIHRDLKPSNVIVTLCDGVPVPKIIDFGIAKAISRQPGEQTDFTRSGQMLGTPLYMSPEQVGLDGVDVDTRTDIYSLGVILYELLTGSTPLEKDRAREASYDEVRRIIREEDPPRPSQRISTLERAAAETVCGEQRTSPRGLRRSLGRDLDWIVMKALHKDRSRRYQTAGELAQDVEHYLADEPIEARPPSLLDRAAKWARRHRPLVASAAAVLILSTVASLAANLLIAREQRRTADAYEENKRQLVATQQAEELAKQQGAAATKQRELAEQQRDSAEYTLYVSNMRLAAHDWATGDSRRLLDVLNAQMPKQGHPDYRGWEWFFLFAQCHAERFTLPSQSGPVAWSPDGNAFATADPMGVVHIWDANSGEPRGFLMGCPGLVGVLSWSPDGKHLAAGSDRSPVVIWEIGISGAPALLRGNAAPVVSIDWNPDSVRVASGARDGTICILDRQTGKSLRALRGTRKPVWLVKWHPDGKRILTDFGTGDGFRVWDTASGRITDLAIHGLDGAAGTAPDGSRRGWVSDSLRVGSASIAKLIPTLGIWEALNGVWSPRRGRLAAVTLGGSIKTWSAATGPDPFSIPAHLASWEAVVDWNRDESLLSSWDNQWIVSVWDVAAVNKAFSTGDRFALSVAFSPDGKRLLVGARYGLVKMYDLASGEETLSVQQPGAMWVRCVAWSRDGRRFAAPCHDNHGNSNQVLVYDATTAKPVLGPFQCEGGIRSLAWSPDGKVLALGSTERVRLFCTTTGKELADTGYIDGTNSLRWRPDGQRLAASGKAIRIWSSALTEESRIPAPPGHRHFVSLDWSPDGKHLAAGTGDGGIMIHDIAGAGPLRVLGEHGGAVEAIRWHPHLPRLASGGWEHQIKIWDTTTGAEVCTLQGHAGLVFGLDWSPDGRQLASAAEDCTVRLWDASPANRFLSRHGDLRAEASGLVQQKKYPQALDILKRLRQLHPGEKALQAEINGVEWLRATQLACDGQLDAAVVAFQQLSARAPDLPDYRLRLPWALFEAGLETEAIEMLEKLVRQSPASGEYREELAYVYERQVTKLAESSQWDQIVPILRKLVKEYPERRLHRLESLLQITLGGSAAEVLESLRKLAAQVPEAPECRHALARHLLALDRPEEALAVEPAIDPARAAGTPDAALYREELAQAYFNRADTKIPNGDLKKALPDLDRAIQYDPQHSAAHEGRGYVYLARGDYDKGIADMAKAIELAPERPVIWYLRALAQLSAGRADDYRKDCAEMLRRFGRTGDVDNAHRTAWTCALGPSAVADWSNVVALAENAVKGNPRAAQYILTLGAVLYRAGRLEEAIQRLAEADRLVPHPTEGADASPAYTWFFLAMAHQRSGHADQAKNWFAKAARWTDIAVRGPGPDQRSPLSWNHRMTLKLLRAEAAELLGIDKNEKKPPAGKEKKKVP